MFIRKAEEKDIPRILELLGQVLQIHADIRPDIFIPGTTKYTTDELTELLKNEEKPVYVAADEADVCVGYAFCQLKEQPFSNNMVPFKSLFIDDLCVDQETRGQHIGESLLLPDREDSSLKNHLSSRKRAGSSKFYFSSATSGITKDADWSFCLMMEKASSTW